MLSVLGRHGKNFPKHARCYRTIRAYSAGQPSKKSGGSGTLITIGTLVVATGGVIGYAKYDPKFRETLVKYVPYSDDVIKFVLQEESTLAHQASAVLENVKKTISGGGSTSSSTTSPNKLEVQQVIKKKTTSAAESDKTYTAPPPPIPILEKEVRKKSEPSHAEISLKKGEGDDKPTVLDAKPTPASSELHSKNLVELEESIRVAATEAVNSYNKATYKLQLYNSEVDTVINSNIDNVQPQKWASIREKSREKDQYAAEADNNAGEAAKRVDKLKSMVSDPKLGLSSLTKDKIIFNIEKIQGDIKEARVRYELEKTLCSCTEKYWNKVEQARKHFAEQLEALFPTIDLSSKKLRISDEDLDLFLLHAYSHVLFYQKELAKLEAINRAKLEAAMDAAKRSGGGDILTDAQITEAVEQEKRSLTLSFQQQCLKLRREAEQELRNQLKHQSQCFIDHLDDEVQIKTQEIERELGRKFDEQLETERMQYKKQLASVVGRLKGLDFGLKAKIDADKAAKNSQVLWNACQALIRAVSYGNPGISWKQQLRPLEAELGSVSKAAADDEFVNVVLSSIPSEAKQRGVFPEIALRERFLQVEEVARNLALVPENGGSLFLYILSYVQSFLLIKHPSPISEAELNDEECNLSELNTNQILQRARYYIDRGDFLQTLRYMNLLQGAPRTIACQWMNETRIFLETQQAADTLMAHAASSGYAAL